MGVALDDALKVKVRYHLRYPQVDSATLIAFGILYAGTNQFVIERAMNNVADLAVPEIQRVVANMDAIETQMVDANQRLQASKADVVTLNPNEHLGLESTYSYWQQRLSEMLSVEINPNTPSGSGAGGINVRIR